MFQACHREGYPSGEMTSEQLKQNPAAAEYMTLGNYSLFKEPTAYMGEQAEWPEKKNTYIRHYFFMTEFRGDNTALCYLTTDDLAQAVTYSDTPALRNNSYMWWIAYNIIYGTNAVIESMAEGTSNVYDHIIGENYFLRAICHFHLVNLFAKPYVQGENNPGVVIRTSTDTSVTVRATVGQVYQQVESDLLAAIRLMGKSSAPRMGNNKGFASKAAAQGLLSRVYLYMGRDDEVITLVDEMLGGAEASAKLGTDITTYYANTLTSEETLWAVGHTANDLGDTPTSKIASMYYTDENGVGWGQVLYSDPLLDLYNRYPTDKRFTSYCVTRLPKGASENDKMIRYAVDNGSMRLPVTAAAIWDDTESKYYFEDEGDNKVWLETETVNGYPQHYIMLNGEKTTARISQATTLTSFNDFPQFFMTKFSFQDGIGMLASPAMIRWGEVILNRAEAYAKEGEDAKALADVNAVRSRAGLSGEALFTTTNYSERGYSTVLDVVLDERRLELCFEGHRAIDQFRNGRDLDRRYAGAQEWGIIKHDNPKFVYRIPSDEIMASGIAQND